MIHLYQRLNNKSNSQIVLVYIIAASRLAELKFYVSKLKTAVLAMMHPTSVPSSIDQN